MALVAAAALFICTPRQVITSGDAHVVVAAVPVYFYSYVLFSILTCTFSVVFFLRLVFVYCSSMVHMVRAIAEGVLCDHSPKSLQQ